MYQATTKAWLCTLVEVIAEGTYTIAKRQARRFMVRALSYVPGAGWALAFVSTDEPVTRVYGVRLRDGEWLAAFEATSGDAAIAQCCAYAGFANVDEARAQGYELIAECR